MRVNNISIFGVRGGNVEEIISAPCEKCYHNTSLMGKDEITLSFVVSSPILFHVGDYITYKNIRYSINRTPDFIQRSEVEHEYNIVFEAPIYILLDKILCNRITGSTKVILTGKLRDFLELLVWNINKSPQNTLGVDSGWNIGNCPDTEYKNIVLDGVNCRSVLDELKNTFQLEYYVSNKTINFVKHIENNTNLTFRQGRGGGLYSLEQRSLDSGDVVTRLYPKGGIHNVIPGEGDENGRLFLPEKFIENFSNSGKVVERVVVFEDIYPTFQGTVGLLSEENNRTFVCNEIDFNIKELAVGSEARVNILTGDLMGKSFEFNWDNDSKKISLVSQEDELALIDNGVRPLIPHDSKKLRGEELFTLTGLKMSGKYKEKAINRLRAKAAEWLEYHSKIRVKYDLEIDYRKFRKKTTLSVGDIVRIKDVDRNINALIRVVSSELNLKTGKLSCSVSNYLDEKWEKKIEGQIASMQTIVSGGSVGGSNTNVDIVELNDSKEFTDSRVLSSLRTVEEISNRAISKTEADTAEEHITFAKGITTLNAIIEQLAQIHQLSVDDVANIAKLVISGELKSDDYSNTDGFKIFSGDNGWSIEIDNVIARKTFKTLELVVQRVVHQGGMIIQSPAGGELTKFYSESPLVWAFYINASDSFFNGDLVLCQTFKGGKTKRYWRKVDSYNSKAKIIFIRKDDCEANSAPCEVGDIIVVLGNKNNPARQNARIISVIGDNAPYTADYKGINDYTLQGKLITQIGNLTGVNDPAFGGNLSGVGAYLGNAYIKGQMVVSSGERVEEFVRGEANTAKSQAITASQQALNTAKTELKAEISEAEKKAELAKMTAGKIMHKDPTFAKGKNDVEVYNNLLNGNVRVERVTRSADNPTSSSHELKITTVGIANPYHGGFTFYTRSRANAVFYLRFLAKIPDGMRAGFVTNRTGNQTEYMWLTPNVGTGRWEEYVHKIVCGSVGEFYSTNYICIYRDAPATPDNPVEWRVAYATVYDATEAEVDYMAEVEQRYVTKSVHSTAVQVLDDKISQKVNRTDFDQHNVKLVEYTSTIQQLATSISQSVKKTDFDDLGRRVGTTESLISQSAGRIDLLITKTNEQADKIEKAKTELKEDASTKAEQAKQGAIQQANNAVAQAKTELKTKISEAEKKAELAKMTAGKILYKDPTFTKGLNDIKVYNNEGNGNVRVERVARSADNPTSSSYELKITTVGIANPYHGGFTFYTRSRANAVFYLRFLAKIPDGMRAGFVTNRTGNQTEYMWLTPNVGTGRWEEYVHKIVCGSVGEFYSTNYICIYRDAPATPDNPVEWRVAYATVYDATEAEVDYMAEVEQRYVTKSVHSTAVQVLDDKISQKLNRTDFDQHNVKLAEHTSTIQQLATSMSQTVKKTDFDDLGRRVNTTESLISQSAGRIDLLITKTNEQADKIENVKTELKEDATSKADSAKSQAISELNKAKKTLEESVSTLRGDLGRTREEVLVEAGRRIDVAKADVESRIKQDIKAGVSLTDDGRLLIVGKEILLSGTAVAKRIVVQGLTAGIADLAQLISDNISTKRIEVKDGATTVALMDASTREVYIGNSAKIGKMSVISSGLRAIGTQFRFEASQDAIGKSAHLSTWATEPSVLGKNTDGVGVRVIGKKHPTYYDTNANRVGLKVDGGVYYDTSRNDYWRMPGILWCAQVNKWGTIISQWGNGLTGVSVSKIGVGVYRVSFSNSDLPQVYMPQITPHTNEHWCSAWVHYLGDNNFSYETVDTGQGKRDIGVMITIFGVPKVKW